MWKFSEYLSHKKRLGQKPQRYLRNLPPSLDHLFFPSNNQIISHLRDDRENAYAGEYICDKYTKKKEIASKVGPRFVWHLILRARRVIHLSRTPETFLVIGRDAWSRCILCDHGANVSQHPRRIHYPAKVKNFNCNLCRNRDENLLFHRSNRYNIANGLTPKKKEVSRAAFSTYCLTIITKSHYALTTPLWKCYGRDVTPAELVTTKVYLLLWLHANWTSRDG